MRVATKKKMRRKKPAPVKRSRKKSAPAPRKKTKRRAPAPILKKKPRLKKSRSKKTRDWRSNPSTRLSILGALKSIAGSLADRLTRAPLDANEVPYLRGIANLKMGRRLTYAQQLAVFAANREGSPLFRSVFGKREKTLIEKFVEKANARALDYTRSSNRMAKRFPELAPGLAWQLAMMNRHEGIFYKPKGGGATQSWSVEGFRRFISNPIYKKRRAGVLNGGTFWISKGRSLQKKGRKKLIVKF